MELIQKIEANKKRLSDISRKIEHLQIEKENLENKIRNQERALPSLSRVTTS